MLILLIFSLASGYQTARVRAGLGGPAFALACMQVLRAPMAFFTANPLGRIVNRFSADQGQVDTLLPIAMFDTLEKGAMALGSVTLGCYAIPWLLLAVPPLCWYLITVRQFATRSLRELKRLDGTSRSPVQQAFTASLQGLETIRAFGRDVETQATFQRLLETNARAWCADALPPSRHASTSPATSPATHPAPASTGRGRGLAHFCGDAS